MTYEQLKTIYNRANEKCQAAIDAKDLVNFYRWQNVCYWIIERQIKSLMR